MSRPSQSEPGPRRGEPRYGRFLAVGAVLGVVAALVTALVGSPGEGAGLVLGWLLVTFGSVGAVLGGLVAVLAAPRSPRRGTARGGRRRGAQGATSSTRSFPWRRKPTRGK